MHTFPLLLSKMEHEKPRG